MTFVAIWGIWLCRLKYFGCNVLKHHVLTHSTQYPVQEITNVEATAEVKIRYTDSLADGLWWLQVVCTRPSKRLVRMKWFLHDWISGIKLVRKILSDVLKTLSYISSTIKWRVRWEGLAYGALPPFSPSGSIEWLCIMIVHEKCRKTVYCISQFIKFKPRFYSGLVWLHLYTHFSSYNLQRIKQLLLLLFYFATKKYFFLLTHSNINTLCFLAISICALCLYRSAIITISFIRYWPYNKYTLDNCSEHLLNTVNWKVGLTQISFSSNLNKKFCLRL